MIQRIRRGNDFKHIWPITWNGQPEDFSDATDITLTTKVYGKVKTLTEGVDYHIGGGTVMIDFTPAICDITGTYTVELNYIKPSAEFTDGDRRSAVDVQAFQIVNTSAEANATEGVSLPSEAMAAYALKYDDLTEAQKDELRGKGITSIDLTGEVGDTKTYTITYADGATFDFSVTDGHTPIFTFVGTVLYIDGAAGPDLKGETGNGIASVELTSTVGLVKTYTITFTDDTTTTFTVTDGSTPEITFQGTTIYIDGVAGPDLKGEAGRGITSVELLSTVGLAKTYRITFTDATTFDYVVTDGAAGTGATVVQTTGGSLVDVMSQKAVTDELDQLAGNLAKNALFDLIGYWKEDGTFQGSGAVVSTDKLDKSYFKKIEITNARFQEADGIYPMIAFKEDGTIYSTFTPSTGAGDKSFIVVADELASDIKYVAFNAIAANNPTCKVFINLPVELQKQADEIAVIENTVNNDLTPFYDRSVEIIDAGSFLLKAYWKVVDNVATLTYSGSALVATPKIPIGGAKEISVIDCYRSSADGIWPVIFFDKDDAYIGACTLPPDPPGGNETFTLSVIPEGAYYAAFSALSTATNRKATIKRIKAEKAVNIDNRLVKQVSVNFSRYGYHSASTGVFAYNTGFGASKKTSLEGVIKIRVDNFYYNAGIPLHPVLFFNAVGELIGSYYPFAVFAPGLNFEIYYESFPEGATHAIFCTSRTLNTVVTLTTYKDLEKDPTIDLESWFKMKEGFVYPNASDKFPNFRKHWIAKDKDLVVVTTGTSLSTGTQRYCSPRVDENERPPLMFNNNISNYIWDKLRWEGQSYRRYDYPSFFIETGTFASSTQLTEWDDKVYRDGQTRYIDGAGSFSFVVPINAWQFNLVYRSDSVGSEAVTLTIAEGNGKMEVWNGAAWVEANGYVFSMRESSVSGITDLSFINPYTETVVNKATYNTKGNTTFQKRLKMRCKSATIDSRAETKAVTVSSTLGRLMYWGVEWSVREFMITYINAARGGHNMDMTTGEDVLSLCHFQDNEVWGFKPDLIFSEIPIINSGGARPGEATRPSTYWGRITENFFFDETVKISMTKRCIDLGLAVPEFVLWNTSISYLLGVDENGELKISADKDGRMLSPADCQMMCYQHVKENHADVFVINAVQQWLEVSRRVYGTPKAAVTPSSAWGDTLTIDDIHWNDLGTKVMAKVILPALDFII